MLSNKQNETNCPNGLDHDWGPLHEVTPVEGEETSGNWFEQECRSCGHIRWVRKNLDNIGLDI